MKKTFLQIKEADQLVAQLYSKNESLEKGKFGYAWKKIIEKNYNPVIKELSEKIEDNRVDNALVNETTKELLIGEDKNYKYSKDGMKTLITINRKLIKDFDEKEIEVIPYYCKDIPLNLTEEETEILKGLIIE